MGGAFGAGGHHDGRGGQAEFDEYIAVLKKNLSVVPYGKETPDADQWKGVGFNKELDWWDPPRSLEGSFVKCTKGEWLIVWYANGWLYVTAGNI